MRCFNNGKQKQNSGDRTYNLKSTVIFNENLELVKDYEMNFDGTFCYDGSGVKKAHSYDLLYSNKKGFKVCDPSCAETNLIPDTPLGTKTVMTIPPITESLIEQVAISGEVDEDNADFTITLNENKQYVSFDPSNVILDIGCKYKKYLNYVDIEQT